MVVKKCSFVVSCCRGNSDRISALVFGLANACCQTEHHSVVCLSDPINVFLRSCNFLLEG